MNFKEKSEYINNRFKNAQFVVSCFKTIEDIDTKILSSEPVILIYDNYVVNHLKKPSRKWEKIHDYYDYFIVYRKEGQEHIYYKDVIDLLIEKEFTRNNCDYKFLEGISEVKTEKRNDNSIKVFSFAWGS